MKLEIEDELAMSHITGRRVHAASNRTYHIKFAPPKVEGLDDITGEPLSIRTQDEPKEVAERIRIYHENEEPYFWPSQKDKDVLVQIDGSKSIQKV